MLARYAWLVPLLVAACVRDDPDHCANRDEDGDVYCASIKDVGGFCSKCTAKDFGCVADVTKIGGDCRPDNVTTAADDDSSTDPSATSTPTDTIADDSATSTSASATTESDDSGSSTTGPPQPVCGNGMLEMGEVCDGTNLDGFTCELSGHENGTLACDDESCEYDYQGCTSQIPVCGDGVVNQMSERCDTSDFNGATCDDQPGHGNMGQLACTENCMIDPTGCCRDADEPCELNSQCCSGLCGVLEQGPNCVLGH